MKTIHYNFIRYFIMILFLITSAGCNSKKEKKATSKPEQIIKPSATYKIEALTNHEYTFSNPTIKKIENPDLTLKRGHTYVFDVETFGHPFLIKTKQIKGTENIYKKGITNNGTEYGKIIFTVPKDAPNTLFYICKFHKMMTGKLTITN